MPSRKITGAEGLGPAALPPGEPNWGWWWHRDVGLDVISRAIPRHHWVRVRLSTSGTVQPGHAWMYAGSIRRDAWRWGRFAFVLMRMPRQTEAQASARAGKGWA